MGQYEKQGPVSRRHMLAQLGAFALTLIGAGAHQATAKNTAKNAAKPAQAAHWDDRLEMAVNFEINRPDESRYRPPYVAVWLEDKSGNPVRTLSLWVENSGRGPRWISDLRRWYREGLALYNAGGPDLIKTISSATRMPGRYTVVWNGRDDRGKPVAQGTYTLNLETAREHGPYTLMQKTVTIGPAPFTAQVAGNEEIKGATIEYRKRV